MSGGWTFSTFGRIKKTLESTLNALRQTVGATPIIFTFRTQHEGGHAISTENYSELISWAMGTQLVEFVDIEVFRGDSIIQSGVSAGVKNGVSTILSFHDFEKTPTSEEMLHVFEKMRQLGGDILKIAVMPISPEDVLSLLSVTCQHKKMYPKIPLITMSMATLEKSVVPQGKSLDPA